MQKSFFILVKAQVLRETEGRFTELKRICEQRGIHRDFVYYLRELDKKEFEKIGDDETKLDEYLSNSRRLCLQEWLFLYC